MSANIGATIYHLLSNDATVAGVVGTRIYPNVAPLLNASTPMAPYIVYHLISTEPTNTKGSLANPGDSTALLRTKNRRSPLDILTIQISMYHRSYSDIATLSAAVRDALDNVVDSGVQPDPVGPVIDSMIFDSMNTQFEKDIAPEGVYHISHDYVVRVINEKFKNPFVNVYSTNFDGNDEYVTMGDSDKFTFGNGTTDSPFSISCWANFDSTASTVGVLGKDSGAAAKEYQVRFGFSGLRFRLYDDSNSAYITKNLAGSLNTGQWYHLVFTYDGSGTHAGMNIYVNGSIPALGFGSSGTYTAMENTASEFTVGRVETTYMDGNIDEVALFNVELTSTQVTSIYNGGTPNDLLLTFNSELNGYWRMGDSGVFPEINDNSSYNNTGECQNMIAADFETDVP
tara:strand:+ start:8168 stop:9364 length:1197 start_codon:yes stop_codon:yes gene_type:complete